MASRNQRSLAPPRRPCPGSPWKVVEGATEPQLNMEGAIHSPRPIIGIHYPSKSPAFPVPLPHRWPVNPSPPCHRGLNPWPRPTASWRWPSRSSPWAGTPFARRYALRAARLYPTSPRAPVVATAANVLLADASSHHAALLLPEPDDPDASPLSVSELCRHFKSLIKSLRVGLDATTAAAYPSVAAAAEEALGRATKAYEALTAPAPGTFWTACAGCRRLHEFERKYVGY
ncbi:uncharacterized protein [Zea mays]|jgi:hypothetical protein|uniref:Uncharacterized protein n=1 Tax=Zea mays TaxID=4577 RepID=A0A1D6L2X4_MAIZE|nr:uncharacterized protein LOC109939290 [Zea mays]ONM08811.1 hypothetical protein ZEAMMB73_Zm00001d033856 [Zea mays]|eukprot:XP_020402883.1 uncharacterized protein LOC109939290 [Zea mays]